MLKAIRGLAWVALRWAALARPRVIVVENVEEFEQWGPLRRGKPDKRRRGETFRKWVDQLRSLGYRVEWRQLRACDYGAPTIRRRLFIVARRDGLPIVWPAATHGEGRLPYRTAAECIEWARPCPSIFERKKPLAVATLRRIAKGIQRYVLESAEPFVVNINHTAPGYEFFRGHGINEPTHTLTAKNCFGLVAPTLIQTGYGEREGQSPRVPGLEKPIGTLVGAGKHALVSAFLAQHNGGAVGREASDPLATITARSTQVQLVSSHLLKLRGTSQVGQGLDEPTPTITAGGTHLAEVRAFLSKYYGTAIGQDPREPLHAITSKGRFGLVTVAGVDYEIADIGMRMLAPSELFRAQGFPGWYKIDPEIDGKPLTKTSQIRLVGNSVSPPCAEAIVRANYAEVEHVEEAVA